MPLSIQVVESMSYLHSSISVASRPMVKAEIKMGEEPNIIAIRLI